MKITNDIKYIGVTDKKVDLFEGQYPVPDGMLYNSYVILDEKIAVMDTVDVDFTKEWLKNLKNEINDREPDYLIVQHMEPDHSANIRNFMDLYKKAVLVSNEKSFAMIKQFFGESYEDRRVIVKEGDTLNLGKHELAFFEAPMVHWPEVIVTYDALDKVLFSADAFGKFGSSTTADEWDSEARRYFIGIVGKYGVQAQSLLKKAGTLDIEIICPLHGPVLSENLSHYISLYDIWSSYRYETDGVFVAYTSVYGNTKKAVTVLKEKLEAKGEKNILLADLARCDLSEAVANAFKFKKVVLATTTYNSGIFPFMHRFLIDLSEHNFQNRVVGIIENGSWAPMAVKVIKGILEKSKNIEYTKNTVTIKSALSDESMMQLDALSAELCK